MNLTFTMLIGLPGCGKTTWCKDNLGENESWLSSDAIRAELFNDENDQSDNARVFQVMNERAINLLKLNKSVIYDATNLNSKRRAALLKQLEGQLYGKPILYRCIIFAIDFDVCLERNENRERKVPYAAMKKMLKNFQPPTYAEGWDRIEFSSPACKTFKETFHMIEDMNNIPQHNPHHTLTIGEHCIEAFNKAFDCGFNKEVVVAALLHDCAKKETKTFTDPNGNHTDIAHYYGHEAASAYKALCWRFTDETKFWLDVATLISLHMVWYMGNQQHEATVRNRVGGDFEEVSENLSKLHICDSEAH